MSAVEFTRLVCQKPAKILEPFSLFKVMVYDPPTFPFSLLFFTIGCIFAILLKESFARCKLKRGQKIRDKSLRVPQTVVDIEARPFR
uniref:Uncharacterized protein n=1 Tax=Panagrolaimus sp. JU765 TaxID=591449 RepID=A0AC34R2L9_9BILA